MTFFRLLLYVKLFVAMGMTWILEIISVAVDAESSIWVVVYILLSLQGFFIFLIFVCKKTTMAKVKKHLIQTSCLGSLYDRYQKLDISEIISHRAHTNGNTLSTDMASRRCTLQDVHKLETSVV